MTDTTSDVWYEGLISDAITNSFSSHKLVVIVLSNDDDQSKQLEHLIESDVC